MIHLHGGLWSLVRFLIQAKLASVSSAFQTEQPEEILGNYYSVSPKSVKLCFSQLSLRSQFSLLVWNKSSYWRIIGSNDIIVNCSKLKLTRCFVFHLNLNGNKRKQPDQRRPLPDVILCSHNRLTSTLLLLIALYRH